MYGVLLSFSEELGFGGTSVVDEEWVFVRFLDFLSILFLMLDKGGKHLSLKGLELQIEWNQIEFVVVLGGASDGEVERHDDMEG